MLHLQQLPSRAKDKTQTGKEGANQRQPYFVLMAVLGADEEKVSFQCGLYSRDSWGDTLCFVKN